MADLAYSLTTKAAQSAQETLRLKEIEDKKQELAATGFVFEQALVPNQKGKIDLGLPETFEEATRRM